LIYKRLDSLIASYIQKSENGQETSEEEKNASHLTVYLSHSKFGFGKYEGMSLSELFEEDSDYIFWCIINLDHFSVHKSLLINRTFLTKRDYYNALETNLLPRRIIISNICIFAAWKKLILEHFLMLN
jgi:hypothetical protein